MDNPGIRTTEFWVTLLAQILAVVAGFFPADSLDPTAAVIGKAIAVLIAVISALGYQASRAKVKVARIQNGLSAKKSK